jgi:hypothetical protein
VTSPESLSASSTESGSSPSSSSIPSAVSSSRGRITNPVSARVSGEDGSGRVIVWLTNGSSIRADEAWEKNDGVWYRQAGMVSFLPSSRVKSIQRLGSPASRSSSVANAVQPNRRVVAQNQTRTGKPEETPKKESRVSMFLKRTGQIIKKPFKL